jgi:hypothetical protein
VIRQVCSLDGLSCWSARRKAKGRVRPNVEMAGSFQGRYLAVSMAGNKGT